MAGKIAEVVRKVKGCEGCARRRRAMLEALKGARMGIDVGQKRIADSALKAIRHKEKQ